ncbi:MAG: hypothetical protein NVSMB65_02380 [Chloroflexota bacterium]
MGNEQGRGGHEATTQPDPRSPSSLPAAQDPGAVHAGAILAAVPDAAFVLDETARLVAFNPAAEQTFGYSRDEVQGRDLVDLIIPPDAGAQFRAGLAADLAVGSGPLIGRRIEMRVMRAGGATFPAEVAVTRLPGAEPPLFLGHVRDITEWRQAEQVLRERAERLRTVVANAPVVLFAVDRHGIFTVSEGRGLESLGITPGEHVGQSYFELYAGLPDSVAAMRRALAGETSTTLDRFKGLVFETRWMPTPAPDGTITGVIGVSADVTERIRLEEERQRLEQRAQETLQALLAMARSLVDIGDQPVPPDAGDSTRQRTVTVATRLAELTRNVIGCERASVTAIDPATGLQTPLALVGATPEVEDLWWRTTPATNLYDPGSDPDMVSRLLAGKSVLIDFTRPPLSEGPNPFGISSVLVAPMRVNDHFVGVLALDHSGVAHQYTADELALAQGVSTLAGIVIERDRLLREREEARGNAAALRAANQRMDEFLGLASHEMRTPLTTVVASIQLAQRRVRRLTEHAGEGDPAAAAALGARVALVDRERLGGECLWTGCVPSKSLIATATAARFLPLRATRRRYCAPK